LNPNSRTHPNHPLVSNYPLLPRLIISICLANDFIPFFTDPGFSRTQKTSKLIQTSSRHLMGIHHRQTVQQENPELGHRHASLGGTGLHRQAVPRGNLESTQKWMSRLAAMYSPARRFLEKSKKLENLAETEQVHAFHNIYIMQFRLNVN